VRDGPHLRIIHVDIVIRQVFRKMVAAEFRRDIPMMRLVRGIRMDLLQANV